jgi:cell division protease FtsH
MGGRAAEEIVLNTETTGAGNDIGRASDLARKMVCDFGMSKELGPLSFGKKDEQIFLGRELSQHRDYGEDTARKIDEEVRSIVTGAYEKTSKLIRDNLDAMHRIANALLEKETLNADDLDEIIGGDKGTAPKKRPARRKPTSPPKETRKPEADPEAPETEGPEEEKE